MAKHGRHSLPQLEEKVRALEAHADEVDREADEARQKAAAEADAARMAQMQQRETELTAMLTQVGGGKAGNRTAAACASLLMVMPTPVLAV